MRGGGFIPSELARELMCLFEPLIDGVVLVFRHTLLALVEATLLSCPVHRRKMLPTLDKNISPRIYNAKSPHPADVGPRDDEANELPQKAISRWVTRNKLMLTSSSSEIAGNLLFVAVFFLSSGEKGFRLKSHQQRSIAGPSPIQMEKVYPWQRVLFGKSAPDKVLKSRFQGLTRR